jgi:hypothetical protein
MVEKKPWEGLYNYYRERAAEVALENAAPQLTLMVALGITSVMARVF